MPKKKQIEPRQRTAKGLEIPVPKRTDVLDALGKAARTPKRPGSESGRRRTSRGDR
jgi:hypothetical protein